MLERAMSPAAPGAFLIYRNADLGLVLSYPSAWQKNEEATPIAFAAAFMAPPEGPQSPFRENVLFTIQPLLAETTLDTLVQFGMRATVRSDSDSLVDAHDPEWDSCSPADLFRPARPAIHDAGKSPDDLCRQIHTQLHILLHRSRRQIPTTISRRCSK